MLVVFLTGCATTGPKFNNAKVDFPIVNSDNGRIYLYRPSKLMGMGYTPDIYLNNVNIGKLSNGGFFYVDKPEAEYIIDSRDGETKSLDPENSIKFTVRKGETKYIKFTFSKVGTALFLVKASIPVMHPEVVDKKSALADLEEMSYINSSVE